MKKAITCLVTMLFSISSFSQISTATVEVSGADDTAPVFPTMKHPINIMVGRFDTDIKRYVDSLDMLMPGNGGCEDCGLKIKVADNGDLAYVNTFNMSNEKFYKCYTIMFRFTRIDGREICTEENIFGSQSQAYYNLLYVKDNFKESGNATWERVMDSDFKIVATYKNQPSDMFEISYVIKKV